MKHIICLLIIMFFCECATKNPFNNIVKKEYCNDTITDSLLMNIPTITNSKFELGNDSNKKIKQKCLKLTSAQFSFFFTKKEQKELADFSEVQIYFVGKKRLGNEKMAIILFFDADYMGFYQYCAIIDKSGKLTGKFLMSYVDSDAGYSDFGKGVFKNDTTYELSESGYEYIDDEHKLAKQNSKTKLIKIGKDSIQIMKDLIYPTDTIIMN